MSLLLRGPGNTHDIFPPARIGHYAKANCAHCLRFEDNNVHFMHVQPYYYRVQQVEDRHQQGEVARRF